MEFWQFTSVAWFYLAALLATALVSITAARTGSGKASGYFTLLTASTLWILGYIAGFFTRTPAMI